MKKNYGLIIVFVLMCVIFTGMTAFAYSPDAQQAGSTPEPSGKDVLVVYFSATGTTKGVAEKIAAITDADLYEILAADDYSDADLNWNDRNSRTTLEQNDPVSVPKSAAIRWTLKDIPRSISGIPSGGVKHRASWTPLWKAMILRKSP